MENTQKEKIFPNGLRFEVPNEIQKEKMPWIKGKISIKVPEFIIFLQKHQNNAGYVNIDLKKSDNTGNLYTELNTWQPKPKVETLQQDEPTIDPMTGRDLTPNEDSPF